MKYEINIKDLAVFELRSLIGRNIFDTKPKLKNGRNYLNLGCGSNIIDGYINADFFYKFKFWKKDTKNLDWQLDLRLPLNCESEVFDGVYSEHTIEHLYPSQVMNLLLDLYRVMKNKSIIRLTVPDLEKYVNFYNGKLHNSDVDEFQKRFKTRCSAIRNITQNYFHHSVWDFEELKIILENVGFINVQKMSFGVSSDERLRLDLKDRAWESLYVEAVKYVTK